MCYGLPSATSAGLRAISNATARSKHYAEDVVPRLMVTVAGLGKPSALPTVEQFPVGALAVVESTQRGLQSAQRSKRPMQRPERPTNTGLGPSNLLPSLPSLPSSQPSRPSLPRILEMTTSSTFHTTRELD